MLLQRKILTIFKIHVLSSLFKMWTHEEEKWESFRYTTVSPDPTKSREGTEEIGPASARLSRSFPGTKETAQNCKEERKAHLELLCNTENDTFSNITQAESTAWVLSRLPLTPSLSPFLSGLGDRERLVGVAARHLALSTCLLLEWTGLEWVKIRGRNTHEQAWLGNTVQCWVYLSNKTLGIHPSVGQMRSEIGPTGSYLPPTFTTTTAAKKCQLWETFLTWGEPDKIWIKICISAS